MDKKIISSFLVSLLFFFGAYCYGFFFPTVTSFSDISLTIVTISFFLAGTIFFGFMAFIPALFFGLALGTQQNAAIIIYIFPLLLALYAGIKLGVTSFEDLNNRIYLTKEVEKIITLVIVAIILAIIIEQTMPIIIEIWPTETFGLEMKQGKDVFEMIESLKTHIR